MTALWKPVPGFEKEYEVSSSGEFRRIGRGPIAVTISPHNGYGYVRLSKNGIAKNFRAHRLVLEAFVGPAPSGHVALHGNGKRSDNRAANLRWGTVSENTLDRHKHGTTNGFYKPGAEHILAKLTDSDVANIRGRLANGERQKDIASDYGVDQSTISNIARGLTYRASKRVEARL